MSACVISGFPAVGKSWLFDNLKDKIILDSDSSQFSWVKDRNGNSTKERNPDFPQNYINHIKDSAEKADIILVSSHSVVRKALQDNNLMYTIVYPDKSLKSEYVERCKARGNASAFVDMIDKNWNDFIDEIEAEAFPCLVKLLSGQYLKDIIYKWNIK